MQRKQFRDCKKKSNVKNSNVIAGLNIQEPTNQDILKQNDILNLSPNNRKNK